MSYNISRENIENIILDTGVIYLNYGEYDERKLAATRGGNSFVVEQDVKIIERDGARGKEKGLRRVVEENATLTVNLLSLSVENMKLALAGAEYDSSTETITNGDGTIAESEYFSNVTYVGQNMNGDDIVISVYNAMGDNGLSIEFNDKDEAVLEIAFAAHYNPKDLSEAIYRITKVDAY